MDKHLGSDSVKIEHTATLCQGFFRVLRYRLRHALFQGGWSASMTRELFVRGDSVGVLLYDPVQDCVALVQQFRIGCLNNEHGAWVWEIVAGMVKPDEHTADVAVREVKEETGLQISAAQLIPITRYYSSPGGSDERLQLFCALCSLSPTLDQLHGLAIEHEDIRVKAFDVHTAFGAILDGTINNAASIIALQWLQIHREALRQQALALDPQT